MMISVVTTCGRRLAHLRHTLPAMVEAAEGAQVSAEVICVDFGPTPGLEAFLRLFSAVRRVPVTASLWNFGKARNAGLRAATGRVFVNMDCDGFIDAESLDAVAVWFEKQGERSYMRSLVRRGVHGRFAFFTDELRALGGFHEDGIDGATHLMGADIEDIYERAELAKFNSARWPKRFEVIHHEIDRNTASLAGQTIRDAMRERRRARGAGRS